MRLAPTHHLEDPEEGHEVASLGGLQLEEVHSDDGEHGHEEPWGRRGSGLPQPFLHSGPSAHPPSCQLRDRAALAGQGAVGPGHKPWPW